MHRRRSPRLIDSLPYHTIDTARLMAGAEAAPEPPASASPCIVMVGVKRADGSQTIWPGRLATAAERKWFIGDQLLEPGTVSAIRCRDSASQWFGYSASKHTPPPPPTMIPGGGLDLRRAALLG